VGGNGGEEPVKSRCFKNHAEGRVSITWTFPADALSNCLVSCCESGFSSDPTETKGAANSFESECTSPEEGRKRKRGENAGIPENPRVDYRGGKRDAEAESETPIRGPKKGDGMSGYVQGKETKLFTRLLEGIISEPEI